MPDYKYLKNHRKFQLPIVLTDELAAALSSSPPPGTGMGSPKTADALRACQEKCL